jgi:hypothetical protein
LDKLPAQRQTHQYNPPRSFLTVRPIADIREIFLYCRASACAETQIEEFYMNLFSRDLVITVGIIGIGMSQAALAVDNPTPVTATATIDWSLLQLSVTGVAGTVPRVVFSDYKTSLDSSSSSPVGSENHSAKRNNWTSTAQTDAASGASLATALASSTIFSGTVNAIGTESIANASGNRTLDFSFDGPGVLTLSVPYTISLTGTGLTCCNFDTASVSGNASFSNLTGGESLNSNSSVSYALNSFNDASSTSKAGNLIFGIVAGDAGTGSLSVGFNLSTNGVGVVPEPESYAMLLAGLGLMGAVVKRRSRNGGG